MLQSGLFLSTRSLLAMSMLMWATRLISAGFGAVGLAGGGAGGVCRASPWLPAQFRLLAACLHPRCVSPPARAPTSLPPTPSTRPAAHEILRQIWVFSNQSFTALDIATQSLVAFHL